MLYSAECFKEAPLRRTIEQIASHHDALRMIFEKTPDGYAPRITGTDESELYHLEVMNYKGKPIRLKRLPIRRMRFKAAWY